MHQRSMLFIVRLFSLGFLLLCLAPAGLGVQAAARPAQAQARQAAVFMAAKKKSADVTVTVAISSTSVEAGGTVAISGTGFLAGEQIDLQLVTTGTLTGTLHLAYATAGADGTFHAGSVAIPDSAPAGSYRLRAVGQHSGRSAGARLQVTVPTATLTVDPTSFAPSADIKVSGTKFGASEKIGFSLSTPSGSASVPIGTAQADASGSFGPTSLHVPFGVPAGSLLLVATGQTSNKQAAVKVTLNAAAPSLTVTPASANPGDKVTVSGSHFQPGETVAIDLLALASSAHLGTTQVGSSGSFTISNLAIPANTPEGTVSLVATGASSRLSATSQIKIGTLPASLTLSPDSLKPGDTLSLTGKGFIPGETVTIVLAGGKLPPLTLGSVVAGTDGSFTIDKLAVPALVPAGSYTLSAAGQTSGRSSKGALTVQAPPPAAPILAILDSAHVDGSPYQVSPGGLLQVAGSNFPAGAKVTIALVNGSGVTPLAVIVANGAGALGPAGVTLPAVTAPGSYTLEARVSGNKVASVDLAVRTLSVSFSVSPDTLTPGATVTVHGSGYAPGEQIVLALNAQALVTQPTTILADRAGAFTASFVVPATVNNGANTLSVSGAASRASLSRILQASLPVASRWYFPNGDTTAGNQTVISVLNSTDAPARLKMTFLYQAEPERSYSQVVPAHTLAAIDLALVAGAGRHVSTILEADRQVTAESSVTYGGGDGDSALGAAGPSRLWYLAEGYTNGTFREVLTVMNPNSAYATIDVRFLPFNNRPARAVRFVMQPRSNISIDAGLYMPKQSISAIVTADKGVVVERMMRFGLNGRGAHDKIGTTAASPVWMFAAAESSAGRQTFFTILNPNEAAPAAVTATFFDSTGKPVGASTIIVDPLHRGNIKLNDVLPDAHVAAVLTSNVPVVVERPFYQGPPDLAQAPSGSVIFGRNGGGLAWAFPGGSTANGDQPQVFLFNPNLQPVTVRATFYTATGFTVGQDLTLAPNGDSLFLPTSVAGLPAGTYGLVLRSTNGRDFVTEQTILNPGAGRASSTEGVAQ